MDTLNFTGWRPIRFYAARGRVMVDWMLLRDEPLRAPFFQQTIQNHLRHPFHLAFRRQTPLEDLLAWHEKSPGLDPVLIIFHVSRCGSTLITQTLAESAHHLQLSEPPPVDFLLRQALQDGLLDAVQAVRALRAWLGAWAQRSGSSSHRETPALESVSLKLDAWNADKAALVARAWPDAPWVFLTREPLSVLVSQMRERAFFLVPGTLGSCLDGLSIPELALMPADLYCARVLAGIYAAMEREFAPGRTLLLDHADLPHAIEAQVLPHMHWQASAQELARMRERSSRHSKHPHQIYSSDSETKHSMASEHLQSLTAQWITPHYQRLQALHRFNDPPAVPARLEEALP